MPNLNSPTSLPYNFDIIETHIDNIFAGSTVEHNGKHMTVGKKDIKSGGFMGTSLFGDSYHSGHKLVNQVIIKTTH